MNAHSIRRHSRVSLTILLVATFPMSSCNMFGGIDSPSTDEQYLSAARVCFDQADYDCARENYGKITGTTLEDQVASDQAFLTLNEEGLDLSSFVDIATNLSGGNILGSFSKAMAEGAGEAKRIRLFNAYKQASKIKQANLQGLVKFITGIALLGELLAEDAGTDGELGSDDIVSDYAVCATKTLDLDITNPTANCGLAAECDSPAGKTLAVGALDLDLDTATDISGPPTFGMIISAINKVSSGLAQLGAGGDLTSGTGDITGALTENFDQTDEIETLAEANGLEFDIDRCFRWILATNIFSAL